MRTKKTDFHWVDFLVCGRALGIGSPYARLRRAIRRRDVRRIGRGVYRVNRARVRRHLDRMRRR